MTKEEPVVTANAQLLLGYLAGCLAENKDATYQPTEWDGETGVMEVKNVHTGNLFRVTVVQTDGIE